MFVDTALELSSTAPTTESRFPALLDRKSTRLVSRPQPPGCVLGPVTRTAASARIPCEAPQPYIVVLHSCRPAGEKQLVVRVVCPFRICRLRGGGGMRCHAGAMAASRLPPLAALPCVRASCWFRCERLRIPIALLVSLGNTSREVNPLEMCCRAPVASSVDVFGGRPFRSGNRLMVRSFGRAAGRPHCAAAEHTGSASSALPQVMWASANEGR